jgi:hypothetical protein
MEFSNLPQYTTNEKIELGISDVLFLYELPIQMLKRGNLNKLSLSSTSLFIGCQTWCTDIKCETEFNILFPHHNVENFIFTKAVLKYVSVNPTYEIDYLPSGYYGICIIDFPVGKPNLLHKLRPENEKDDRNRYDRLYLTKKSAFEKIIYKLGTYHDKQK